MALRKEAVRLLCILLCVSSFAAARRHDDRRKRSPYQDSDGYNRQRIEKSYKGPTTRYYDWTVELAPATSNCVTKQSILVNGQFPGPAIYAVEGDTVIVKVRNEADADLTIHWHGIHQKRSCWHDGVAHITQCPIKKGDYFVYNFTVEDQRGTSFWHAHTNWLRATVHGAIVIYPKDFKYPHAKPDQEFNVLLGEWWNLSDPNEVEAAGLLTGANFELADALLINGKPGSNYNCSDTEGITTFKVTPGRTYLLRVINAGINSEEFFSIAKHKQTVVEVDGAYVVPTEFQDTFIAPGQTMNVLIKADQKPGSYYMVAKGHTSVQLTDPAELPPPAIPTIVNDIPRIPSTALVQYDCAPTLDPKTTFEAQVPEDNDTATALSFEEGLFTLHPEEVPPRADRYQLFTVGVAVDFCDNATQPCEFRAVGEMNNVTFVNPEIDILQAYYFKIDGVYTTDFPDFPENPRDYTNPDAPAIASQLATLGTKVSVLEYGTIVDLVLQGTNNFAFENHPFHLHGFNFWVLGRGEGNYDGEESPKTLNYYNPPSRFTVDVPARGWVAIRFHATNPGVWLLHCHLDKHTSWGMQMAYIVKDGKGPKESLLPPPPRLTKCKA